MTMPIHAEFGLNNMILTNAEQPKVGQYYLNNDIYHYIVAVDYMYASNSVSVYWLEYEKDYILKKDKKSSSNIMDFVYDDQITFKGVYYEKY